MGVRGLASFVEKRNIAKDHQLQNQNLIVDANNIKALIFINCHQHDKADRNGGDMVRFAQSIRNFFENLRRAGVEPTFVFDGAKDLSSNDKSEEQIGRNIQRFEKVKKLYNHGTCEDIMMPRSTAIVFKTLIEEFGFTIKACMYEADNEIARLSNELEGPVLSNDSNILVMNLKYGVISFNGGDFLDTKGRHTDRSPIKCKLYTQDNLIKYYPGLKADCLPLLAVLAGNDFVDNNKFEGFLKQMPRSRIVGSYSHRKLDQILTYMRNKSLDIVIKDISSRSLIRNEPGELRKFIERKLEFYSIQASDIFLEELRDKICSIGKESQFKNSDKDYLEAVDELARYIVDALENNALNERILDNLHRNVMYMTPIIEHLDKPKSSRFCMKRIYAIMVRLLRTHQEEKRPLIMYDRVGDEYAKIVIEQLVEIDNFGKIDYLVYDLVSMNEDDRKKLLLASFYYSIDQFESELDTFGLYFDTENAQQAVYIKLTFNYLKESAPEVIFTDSFKKAVYTTFIYYVHEKDSTYGQVASKDELEMSIGKIHKANLSKPLRTGLMDFDILHQLAFFSAAISAFHLLDSLLKEPLARFRIDNWYNGCLIYNLTKKNDKEAFHIHEKTQIAFE